MDRFRIVPAIPTDHDTPYRLACGTPVGMYRVKYRDGKLSDMLNLSRAKDLLRQLEEQGK